MSTFRSFSNYGADLIPRSEFTQAHAQSANSPANATKFIVIESRNGENKYNDISTFSVRLNNPIPNVKKLFLKYITYPISFFPAQNLYFRYRFPSADRHANAANPPDQNTAWYFTKLNGNYTSQSALNKLSQQIQIDIDKQGITKTNPPKIYFQVDTNLKVNIYSNSKLEIQTLQTPTNYLADISSYQNNEYDKFIVADNIPNFKDAASQLFGFPYEVDPNSKAIQETGNYGPFTDDPNGAIPYTFKLTAPYVATLQPYQYMNLYCDIPISTTHTNEQESGNIMAQLPVTDFGTTVSLNGENFYEIDVDCNLLQEITFSLRFRNNIKPEFDPNFHISMILKTWYYDPEIAPSFAMPQHLG
jgi:hypothetical protein